MREDLAPSLTHSNRTYILYHKKIKNAIGLLNFYCAFSNIFKFFCKILKSFLFFLTKPCTCAKIKLIKIGRRKYYGGTDFHFLQT